MKISREIKTGVLVVGALALLYFGIRYLMSKPIFSSDRVFYAEYSHVGGLVPSTVVFINGNPVGKIQDIKLLQNGRSVVTFSMSHDFQFSKNSEVQLQENGLIGGKLLAIIPKIDGSPYAVSGDTLPTFIKPGLTELVQQKLTPLQEKIENMVVSADSLLTAVNGVLNSDSRNNIKNGLAQLNSTLTNFKRASNTLNSILDTNKEKLDHTLNNVDNVTTNLSQLSDSLARIKINETMAQLQETIGGFDKIVKGIEKGDGSLGKLLKDEGLYNNLSGASSQLEQLLEDMKLNPKRYVHFSLFGKKAKQYKPKEEETKEKN